MLHTVTAERITPLAAHLGELLSTPLEDPFSPEWIAVPTTGMQRWLQLELARVLGSSSRDLADGVATNLGITFPGALRAALFNPEDNDDESPWMVDRLVWTTLAVLLHQRTNAAIAEFMQLSEARTWFSRSRQIADLFDRYSARRPALLRRWHAGEDIDGLGSAIDPADRWQPILWRALRSRVGEQSPAEQLPEILDRVRAGEIDLELPARLIFFGLTTFPNGHEFLDLIDAVAQQRDVYLYLLDPAPRANARCAQASDPRDLLRAHDHSETLIGHPLLRSWGRPYRERTLLLEQAKAEGRIQPKEMLLAQTGARQSTPSSLLQQVQCDIANDHAPGASFVLDPRDTSLQIHACYGELRQVEALRNAILHELLADRSLQEEDVVVLCPNIQRFAPLIEAGFGPSVDHVTEAMDAHAPKLRWRLSDRSLRPSQPVFTALEALLSIAGTQASVSEVLAFISLESVCRRFRLSTDDLATAERWVEKGRVRWGLTSDQRAHWGLPEGINQGTWAELIDRLTLGLALNDEIELPPGGIGPIDVDTEAGELLGRFIDLLHRLRRFIVAAGRPQSIGEWCTLLQMTVTTLFACDEDDRWQLDQTLEMIGRVRESAEHISPFDLNALVLRDVIQIVHEGVDKNGGRSNFFRGGITVTSLLPLRWIPYRVVCLLGMDEESFGSGATIDGDDLIARAPYLGDRDARSEIRQTLLEALLTAGQSCILTRTGRSIKTNHEVPAATVVAELVDVVTATVEERSRSLVQGGIVRSHDRHGFADDEFVRGQHLPDRAWSFSRTSLVEASRRRERTRSPSTSPQPFAIQLSTPDDAVIRIDQLIALVRHPIKFYYENRLQCSFPPSLKEVNERLPVELGGLPAWEVATSWITSFLQGEEFDRWRDHERAMGTLPIGRLGEIALESIFSNVDAITQEASRLGFDRCENQLEEISIVLPDGTEVQGAIPLNLKAPRYGTLDITYSAEKDEHHLAAWIRLMALAATDATIDWKSIVVARNGKRANAIALSLPKRSAAELQELAIDAFSTLTDLYRRALSEPLPLFGGISQKIHHNKATANDWLPFEGRGPGDDRITQFAFGPLGLVEVLALPVQPHDPEGLSSARAKRLADYLWSTVERTSVRDA